jgi:hypothetical protein
MVGGYPFLSWEKENFEEIRVKRSILTTFVATKAQKRLNLDLTISLKLFQVLPIFCDFS